MPAKIAILKTGSTHAKLQTLFGDFDDWFRVSSKLANFTLFQTHLGETLPAASDYDGFIITGSPAMVTDRQPWSENLKHWLVDAMEQERALLAVCYGHQLLADAMGGETGWHPLGREIGTVPVQLTDDGVNDALLGQLPQTFLAQVTHAQTVLKLPTNATLLAFNDFEPHHAFRIGKQAWGVQFHPEFSADIMRGYLFETSEKLLNDGINVKGKLEHVKDAEANDALIKRFIDLLG